MPIQFHMKLWSKHRIVLLWNFHRFFSNCVSSQCVKGCKIWSKRKINPPSSKRWLILCISFQSSADLDSVKKGLVFNSVIYFSFWTHSKDVATVGKRNINRPLSLFHNNPSFFFSDWLCLQFNAKRVACFRYLKISLCRRLAIITRWAVLNHLQSFKRSKRKKNNKQIKQERKRKTTTTNNSLNYMVLKSHSPKIIS